MFDRFEGYLTVIISLLGAITALITAISRIMAMWRERQAVDEDESISQLERDIVRLDAVVRRQQAELEDLQVQSRHKLETIN